MTKSSKKKVGLNDINSEEAIGAISVLADIDNSNDESRKELLEEATKLPILPLRNTFLFPSSVLSVSVGRESSLKLIHHVAKEKGYMGVFCQIHPDKEAPTFKELYKLGSLAKIIRVFEMPDQSTTVVLQGLQRIELTSLQHTESYMIGDVMP